MLNFEWYRSFIAVYRSGTVTGAAEARSLTQPAISQHISSLETLLGAELFLRRPRRMVPTEQGQALYTQVAPALDALEAASLQTRNPSEAVLPLIRLGAPLEYFQERAMSRLSPHCCRLKLEFGETAAMIDRLVQGKLDVVIATQQIRSASIDYQLLDREEFCLIAPSSMSIPSGFEDEGHLERFLLEQSWISYSAELPIIRRYWQTRFKKRPAIEPLMLAPNIHLVLQAVKAGWGISVVPRYLCRREMEAGELRILEAPAVTVENDLWLASRRVDRNRPELANLRSLLMEKA